MGSGAFPLSGMFDEKVSFEGPYGKFLIYLNDVRRAGSAHFQYPPLITDVDSLRGSRRRERTYIDTYIHTREQRASRWSHARKGRVARVCRPPRVASAASFSPAVSSERMNEPSNLFQERGREQRAHRSATQPPIISVISLARERERPGAAIEWTASCASRSAAMARRP